MNILVLQPILYKEENRILLNFKIDDASLVLESQIMQLLKANFATIRWSQTHLSWHLASEIKTQSDLFKTLKGIIYIDYSLLKVVGEAFACKTMTKKRLVPSDNLLKLTQNQQEKLVEFRNYLTSQRYAENTIKTYVDAISTFLRFYSEKPISDIQNLDIINFNNEYILKNNYSASFQNQVVNAVKLFFQVIDEKKIVVELIQRPRREHKLPNVLSKEEVKDILNAHHNLKHKTMLSLIYSCGLRCGELLNLMPLDIDSKRNIVLIKQSKGKKDRIVSLSPKILEMLREYYKMYKPKSFLFEGEKPFSQYSERSLQQVLKQALVKCKIRKPVTLHWLRHSYATHLLESGTNLRYIQDLLGHSSSKTTEIYTHVSTHSIQNIISPFDSL